MNRRHVLRSVAGVAGVGVAGCVSTDSGGSTTTVAPVTSDLVASVTGSFPHEVIVRNEGGDAVSVTVRVSRDDDLLYRKTHSVAPTGTEQVVAGITEETLPEGRRTLRVGLTYDGQTKGVTVRVSDCLGDVLGSIDRSGELGVTYSIC